MTIPKPSSRLGFTLVELLIVIVVIGILATIVGVSYRGIQDRARVSVAQSDLKTIGTVVQLYHAEEGSYPRNVGELLEAFKRQPQALALGVTNTGSYASNEPKSFMYCYSNDGSSMWIVAWKPVTGSSQGTADGTPVYYWTNGGLAETTYKFDGSQAGSSLCTVASKGTYTDSTWSYNPNLRQ